MLLRCCHFQLEVECSEGSCLGSIRHGWAAGLGVQIPKVPSNHVPRPVNLQVASVKACPLKGVNHFGGFVGESRLDSLCRLSTVRSARYETLPRRVRASSTRVSLASATACGSAASAERGLSAGRSESIGAALTCVFLPVSVWPWHAGEPPLPSAGYPRANGTVRSHAHTTACLVCRAAHIGSGARYRYGRAP